MDIRIKTLNLFSFKLTSIIILTVLFLCSCEHNSNKNMSLNEKFIDIYKLDIKMKNNEMSELYEVNPMKYKEALFEIKGVQHKFDSIYNLVEEDNLNINPLLKEIYDQTKKYYQFNTAKKIELLLNTNTTVIDKVELQTMLLELNSTIISQIRCGLYKKSDYIFNKIKVIVIPEEREIKLGDTYKAFVVIAGVDTTALPLITYENQSNQIKSKYNTLQIKTEKKGKFKYKGVVNLMANEEKKENKYPFEFEFEFEVK